MKEQIESAGHATRPEPEPHKEAGERAATLGSLLRASREARQLSIAEISAQTNIFPQHLLALEADQLLQVPATFARGYAKAYATALGIEPEYLDRLLPAAEIQKNIDTAASASATPPQRKKRVGFRSGSSWSRGLLGSPDGLLRAATTTTLPLLVLCVLAFAYHAIDSEFDAARDKTLSRHALGQAPEALGTLAHQAVAAPAGADSTRLTLGARSPAPQPGTPAQNDSATPVVAASDTVAASAAGEAVDSARSPGIVASVTAGASGAASEGTYTGFSLPHPPASRSSQTVVPNANMRDLHEPVGPGAVDMIAQLQVPDRLVIEVYEDSWIDIRDSQGIRLYRNLARAGRRIDVSGSLPFALHVGNAPGVELELNGERIPITRYRADNSARLTLASN
ncbi:MAG: RodZ domain-containing protein [Pseudomonadales bacterium]